jgi:hypothetical protein
MEEMKFSGEEGDIGEFETWYTSKYDVNLYENDCRYEQTAKLS